MSYGIQLPNGSQKLMTSLASGTVAEAVSIAYTNVNGEKDAFGRGRMSTPETLFDYQNQYDANPNLWNSATANGTVTHLPNESSVEMRVSAGTLAASVARQTYMYHRYQPGKSQLINMTFDMAPWQANLVQRAGYYDTSNGIFLERGADGVVYMVIRSKITGSVVENRVAQSAWNVDKLDGTGGDANPSGITLDLDKAQILSIDLEWLGVGSVRVGFVIDKTLYYVHVFDHSNIISTVYMTTANLPLRYEILAQGGTITSSAAMKQICATVVSEGGFQEGYGYRMSGGNGTTAIACTGRRPVFSIRPRLQFNGIENRGQIRIESIELNVSNNPCQVEVMWNPTLSTGTAFGTVVGQGAFSIADVDVGASAVSGGIPVKSGYVTATGVGGAIRGSGNQLIASELPLGLDINGQNPQQISIVINPIGGPSTVSCLVNWIEMR